MNKGTILRTSACIFTFALWLYSYIEKQNELTDFRIRIPELAKAVKGLHEENIRLQYAIDQYENPQHLIELSRHVEFAHLKHPLEKEVLTCKEGLAIYPEAPAKKETLSIKPKHTLAAHAK